jgi:pimeloyl-ACP methyl ester carboxylesterase
MLEAILKKVLSLAISALLIYVPKEKVEKEMAMLPTMEQRAAAAQLKGWSFEKAHSDSTGITHYYYHFSSADESAYPLVCLHGFNTDGRVFLNLKTVSDRFALYAYNFPEESPYYTGNLSDFKIVLDDFCSVMNFDSVIIVGNSVGGGIAMHYCASSPPVEIVALVLLSTSVFGATEDDAKRYRGMADKLLPYPDYKLFYLLQKGQNIVSMFERTELGENAPGDVIATKRIGWYRQILRSLYDYDGREAAKKISCPVMAIHGSADRVIPLEAARTIPEFVANAQLTQLQDVGHSMVYSDAEKVGQIIRDFVAPKAAPDSLMQNKQAKL